MSFAKFTLLLSESHVNMAIREFPYFPILPVDFLSVPKYACVAKEKQP